MSLVNETSLSATLDAVNEALFFGRPLSQADRVEAAEWIAQRQAQHNGYRDALPAPLEADLGGRARLFTGEALKSWAGTAHILGEEACRALIRLDAPSPNVQAALSDATQAMQGVLGQMVAEGWFDKRPGVFCCARCSVSIWRHMAAGGLAGADPVRWLEGGLRTLAVQRTEDGRWHGFPFYYTLLALTEIDLPGAREELRYVAPVCERLLRRAAGADVYVTRRRAVMERALACCA